MNTEKFKKWFIEKNGFTPESYFGPEWEECIEEYLEQVNDEEFMIDRL